MKRKKQERINETLKHLDVMNRQINTIRLHKNTTLAHRLKIFEICSWILDHNYSFVTEAIGKDRKWRADIVCLDNGTAYEVIDSERKKKPNKTYPIPTYYISIDEEWKGL